MSFPTSPTNGQLAVINGITYQWSSTYNSWTRIAAQVTATNTLSITGNVITTSTTTGALVVTGGVGVGGAVNIGQTSTIAGAVIITTATIGNYAAAANTATSATSVSFTIYDTTPSTSTTTGALIVAGGAGIGGSVNIAQDSTIAGAVIVTTATIANYAAGVANTATYSGYSSTASAVTVVPAVGCGSYYFTFVSTTSGVLSVVSDAGGRLTYNPGPGQLAINGGPQSTSTTTGALVVQGGAGISGNVNVGGSVNISGGQTSITTTSTTGGSLSFSQSSRQYLSATVPTIGTNDFTIEYWMFNGSGTSIFNGAGTVGATYGIFVQGQSGYWQISVGNGSGWTVTSLNFQPLAATVGVWTHHAFVRSGGVFQVYVNGTSVYSKSMPSVSIANQYLQIGAQTRNSLYFGGNITNFRFVNGSAVYTGNFTPPNQPLTAISNTALLLDVVNSGAYLTDTSGNSVSVSPTNGVSYSSATPFVPVTTTTIIPGAIQSSSTNTGALVVAGGVGIGGAVNIGQTSTIAGAVIITTATVAQYISGTPATTATNLAGGTAGQLVYQSGPSNTGFVGPGTAGQVLVSNGTSAPSYSSQLSLSLITATNLIVSSTQSSTSSYSSNALYVAGGIGGNGGFNINGNGYLNGNLTVNGIITGTNVSLNTLIANSGTFYGATCGTGALYAGVTGYTPFAQTMFQASGNLNNYMEINVQNINSGAKASTDIVASADNVTVSSAYIDMGIASSTFDGTQLYSLGTTIGPNDGYLMVGQNATAGLGDLVFGTLTSGTQMRFVLSNGATTVTNAAIAVVMNSPNTPSTSTSTGTLVVVGGAGISGALYAGATSYIAGAQIITTATIGNYSAAANTATSATSVSFTIFDKTASTSTTTGALIVGGGAGIGGNVNVGGVVTATNLFVGPWPVSTASNGTLNIQYNGASLGSATTINFATGTTATLVGGVLTVQSTGLRSYSTSTPPANPSIGDIWYNTATDDMLRYTTDGVNFFWLDINGPYGSGGGGTSLAQVGAYTSATIRTVTGSIGQMTAISDQGGKIAYWDTTNLRWSYILNGSAV